MMKTLTISIGLAAAVAAQDVPLQRPEERLATQKQSREVFDVVSPVARAASESTVYVWAPVARRMGVKRDWVATGTVVGDGSQVITKWSEISAAAGEIWVEGWDGRTATAKVKGVYPDDDVAVLELDGEKFKAVTWSREGTPRLGRFMVAASPDGVPFGLGVVAVKERVLKESEQAFLGVEAQVGYQGEGVQVKSLDERGGAKAAGMRERDVILKVGDREIGSAYELRNSLLGYAPGDRVKLSLLRDGRPMEVEVELKQRPRFPGFPEGRLETMRGMGTERSLVRDGFPVAIQTDMRLERAECGGPVVDLDGNVLGMTIARTDRTRSFILSAERIERLLGTNPVAPELAQRDEEAADDVPLAMAPAPQMAPPLRRGQVETLQNAMGEMEEFLERMRREMSAAGLDEP